MIERTRAEQAFREAVVACDPAPRVARVLGELDAGAWRAPQVPRIGIALGKSALAMARGAGPVTRGIAVTVADDGRGLPDGWQAMFAGHPQPDARSVLAGQAVAALVAGAMPTDRVIALVSGGASALVELPRGTLDELRAVTSSLMAAGAPIGELNVVRSALSELKAGGLALGSAAPILTLVASDVIGDPVDVVGSGPTVGPWLDAPGGQVDAGAAAEARRLAAVAILRRYGLVVPPVLERPIASRSVIRHDRAQLVIGIDAFAEEVRIALGARRRGPHAGTVTEVADELAGTPGLVVAWGEPTLAVPTVHGEGGRSQQLALELSRRLRGTDRSALVAGSDGIDGPFPRGRPAPAGAFVDGTTWDRIVAAGLDPAAALAGCDAGRVLHAVGALFVTGPTGVNHADLVILG